MDPILLAKILGYAVTYGPTVVAAWNEATSNDSFTDKVRKIAPPLAPLLEQVGSAAYPGAAPALHIVAGVIASFSPDAMWLQKSLNIYLGSDLAQPLVVDGVIGPKTKAAVKQAQAKLGLVVDGLAGKLTAAGLDYALSLLAKK